MTGLAGVSFRYGERDVLKEATLELPSAGAVCLFGPSGCGKTTALHLLAGILAPASGTVNVPEEIAAVFQEDRLLPWRSSIQNTCLPPGVDRGEALLLLRRLGLEEVEKPVAQLSGGQKRRVAIARALAAKSGLLLLDEPFRGLDEEARLIAAEIIRERIASIPCVLVTHDRGEAALLNARIREMPGDGSIGRDAG